MKAIHSIAALLLSACATAPQQAAIPAPYVAAHQHLVSPAFAPIVKFDPIDGADLLRMLDDAGIRRGVVLSMAYSFADERKKVPDPDRHVREENDWTARQIALSHGRLIGFCSVNPLRPAALAEFDRCLRLPGMRGLKLHLGNSGVTLRDPAHVAVMERLFAAANARRAPIVVHLRARGGTNYGRQDGETFLARLLPAAPDVVVQVAHLAGSGGYDDSQDEVMDVFARAIAAHDPRTRNLWFDITTNVQPDSTADDLARIAARIRQVGVRRILFGSDLPVAGNLPPKESWALFRDKIPLTPAELGQIARNRPPYMR